MTAGPKLYWTPDVVKERLKEAADVIRRLPPPRSPAEYPPDTVVRMQRQHPGLLEATWGLGWEIGVREYDKNFQPVYETRREAMTALPGKPDPQEIDRAWEAYEWLALLDAPIDARLLWDWANGFPLWMLASKFGKRSEAQVRYWRDKCITGICDALKERKKVVALSR